MADTKYLDTLVDSIRAIYREEKDYFSPMQGCEQAVQFRIAHRMADQIEHQTKDIKVDCEARKCNGYIKVDKKRPDIIIHKRKSTDYLVVEIKCNKRNWNNDFDKLVRFTHKNKPNLSGDNVPTYELGAFVYLADNEQDKAIRIYENGKDVTNEYPYNKFLEDFKYAEIRR